MSIKFKRPRNSYEDVVLIVQTLDDGDYEPATPDDLRRACEVVGMVTLDKFDAGAALSQAIDDLDTAKKLIASMEDRDAANEAERAEILKRANDMHDRAVKAERLHSEAERQIACRNELRAALRTEKARAEKAEEQLALMTSMAQEANSARFGADIKERNIRSMFFLVADAVGLVHEQSMGPRMAAPAEEVVGAVRGFVAENADLRAKLAAAEASLSLRTQVGDITVLNSGDATKVDALHARIKELEEHLSALTAPAEGEPTLEEMRNGWFAYVGYGPPAYAEFALTQWRAGYAACAARHADSEAAFLAVRYALRDIHDADDLPMVGDVERLVRELGQRAEDADGARHQPTEPRATEETTARRATDEEMIDCYLRAERAEAFGRAHVAGVMAVRDLLRAERAGWDYEPAWLLAAARANHCEAMLGLALESGLAECEGLRAAVRGLASRLGEQDASLRRAGFTHEAIAGILRAYAGDDVSLSRAVEMVRELAPHVRAERPACLVERAVRGAERARIRSIVVMEALGTSVLIVIAHSRGISGAPHQLQRLCALTDVPATLEAMLTEVGA